MVVITRGFYGLDCHKRGDVLALDPKEEERIVGLGIAEFVDEEATVGDLAEDWDENLTEDLEDDGLFEGDDIL